MQPFLRVAERHGSIQGVGGDIGSIQFECDDAESGLNRRKRRRRRRGTLIRGKGLLARSLPILRLG